MDTTEVAKNIIKKSGNFWSDFREFIAKGNALTMAIGVVIGTAFTAIVNSLVADLINPLLSLFTHGIDFSSLKLVIGKGENAASFNYGSFIMAVINFLIIAFVLFLIIRYLTHLQKSIDALKAKKADEEGPTEKDCPYCLQSIPVGASRCYHCTSHLEEQE